MTRNHTIHPPSSMHDNTTTRGLISPTITKMRPSRFSHLLTAGELGHLLGEQRSRLPRLRKRGRLRCGALCATFAAVLAFTLFLGAHAFPTDKGQDVSKPAGSGGPAGAADVVDRAGSRGGNLPFEKQTSSCCCHLSGLFLGYDAITNITTVPLAGQQQHACNYCYVCLYHIAAGMVGSQVTQVEPTTWLQSHLVGISHASGMHTLVTLPASTHVGWAVIRFRPVGIYRCGWLLLAWQIR